MITYCFALISVLLAGPLLALATSKPVPGEIMLVIGPDPSAQYAMVKEAGGRPLGPEIARFGLLVISENEDFATSLMQEGAWFVVDGRQMALLCGVET